MTQIFRQYGQDGDSNKLIQSLTQLDIDMGNANLVRLLDGTQPTLARPSTMSDSDEIEWPNTPPTEFQEQTKVQFRVGKKDWKMLTDLNNHLSDISSDIAALNEFILCKLNPDHVECINLVELKQDSLKSAYDSIIKNSEWTNSSRHLIMKTPLPPRITITNTKRPHASVRNGNGNSNCNIALTAIVTYYRPARCRHIRNNGLVCKMRHRTVQEFSEEHPEFRPNEVHISHLCHYPLCIFWHHLIMEPSKVNLHRNNCRRNCQCGGLPKCFTDSD